MRLQAGGSRNEEMGRRLRHLTSFRSSSYNSTTRNWHKQVPLNFKLKDFVPRVDQV
jgi:hypothetical protein